MAVAILSLVISTVCVSGITHASEATFQDLFDVVQSLQSEVTELKMKAVEQENEITKLRTTVQEQRDNCHTRERRAPERVAFSAYLSQSQQHTGIGQKIKYDSLLLNEGNGYNPHLGAFVAPTSGLYLFSYTISKAHVGYALVHLMKNGIIINSAVVHLTSEYDDTQAGNVALVNLDVGDVVYVEEYWQSDAVVHGSTVDRWTTFSGVLLI